MPMPGFPSEDLQREIHGHANEVSLHEAHVFYREVIAYCAYAGRPIAPHRTILDFGCGWGRMLRLFIKDIEPANLFGADSTSRFLMEARRCNPSVNFLSCQLAPPMILEPESLDYIISWSVFSHLDEFLSLRWIEEFSRLLKPGGLLLITTQSRRFIAFCAEMRLRRASGICLEHPCYGSCANSFVDETLENARYEAGQFLHAASAVALWRSGDLARLCGETMGPFVPVDRFSRQSGPPSAGLAGAAETIGSMIAAPAAGPDPSGDAVIFAEWANPWMKLPN